MLGRLNVNVTVILHIELSQFHSRRSDQDSNGPLHQNERTLDQSGWSFAPVRKAPVSQNDVFLGLSTFI